MGHTAVYCIFKENKMIFFQHMSQVFFSSPKKPSQESGHILYAVQQIIPVYNVGT